MRQKSYKNTLTGAAASTAFLVIMLIAMIRSKDGGDNVILVLSSMAFTVMSLLQWIKGTKQYIDFRFQELEKEKAELEQ